MSNHRPYVLMIVASLALVVTALFIVRSVLEGGQNDPHPEAGVYSKADAEARVGFTVPELSDGCLPTAVTRTSQGVGVMSRRSVSVGYDGRPSKPEQGISIEVGPKGALVEEQSSGLRKNRRAVNVHGQAAAIDTWSETTQYNAGGAPFRSIFWQEGDYDYFVVAQALTDKELLRAADCVHVRSTK